MASCVINSPATTRVSLFAKAIFFLALMASIVGSNPAKPTKAETTISTDGIVTTSHNAEEPAYTFTSVSANASRSCSYLSSLAITTASGLNFLACSISNSTLLFAVSTRTSNISPCSSATRRVWVPIDPVEPNIAIFFLYIIFYLSAATPQEDSLLLFFVSRQDY